MRYQRYFFITSLLVALLLLGGCSGNSSGSSGLPLAGNPTPYTVSGTARYEDMEYAENGWVLDADAGYVPKSTYKPVRHALVDLLGSDGALLATVSTDGNGNFLFDNVMLAAAPATVRVMAESDSASGSKVTIRNLSNAGYAATLSLAGLDLASPVTIDISRASGLGGAFNLLDVYQNAFEFVASHASAPVLPALNVFWKNGDGSYTCSAAQSCPQGAGIYVYSAYGDQDEYDDDVLWHEFAHFIEYSINATDSPGGFHTFFINTLDLRLAWSEGHADYLQTAIKRWLRAHHPERLSIPAIAESWYVDTSSVGSILLKLDLANPDITLCGGTNCFIYASSEIAVAKALWMSSSSLGEGAIWSNFAEYLPTVNDGLPTVIDNLRNMEAFWDGLLTQLPSMGKTESDAATFFVERRIFYTSDGYEPDDAAGQRASVIDCSSTPQGGVCVNEQHTLYRGSGVSDKDLVPITVTSGRSYTFATAPMVNGLDSYLEIIDQDGTTILAFNDDVLDCDNDPDTPIPGCSNNGTFFSSHLSYTPSYSGTLYVRISTVPYYVEPTFYRGVGAGAYGGYTLTVTAN